jgi:hypothetical protein
VIVRDRSEKKRQMKEAAAYRKEWKESATQAGQDPGQSSGTMAQYLETDGVEKYRDNS